MLIKEQLDTETNDNAKWVMELLLENAEIAKTNKVPLCDDTGIPHVLIEVGNQVHTTWRIFQGHK